MIGFDIMLSVVSHEMQPSFSINRIFNKSSNSIAVVLAAVVALQDVRNDGKGLTILYRWNLKNDSIID